MSCAVASSSTPTDALTFESIAPVGRVFIMPSASLWPIVKHCGLGTTFLGVVHPSSSTDAAVHQYRGIQYGNVSTRFRQAKLQTRYESSTDARTYGPICPQPVAHSIDAYGIPEPEPDAKPPRQHEFECLNLNITCPAGLEKRSRVPVMVWIHGEGSGSESLCDSGALVRKSVEIQKPVMVVALNFRLGLLGAAASPALLEDNREAGSDGVGNFGLRDQRTALEWVHRHISAFGGDPNNVTLFGTGCGAHDILCHLLSPDTAKQPRYFNRAIVQSGVLTEQSVTDVSSAGWKLGKLMGSFGARTLADLRAVPVEELVARAGGRRGTTVDDGFFFADDWKERLAAANFGCDVIIGDNGFEAAKSERSASLWTTSQLLRRVRAVLHNPYKADALLSVYNICPYTADEDLSENLLDLLNDALYAYPIDCTSRPKEGGCNLYRYVFDQGSPFNFTPHHGVEILYLFDNVPLRSCGTPPASSREGEYVFYSDSEEDRSDGDALSDDGFGDDPFGASFDLSASCSSAGSWGATDAWMHTRVRDAMQSAWLSFAQGQAPWRPSPSHVYVFGPEGETGERSRTLFESRRRVEAWKTAFDPLGMHLVHKLGVELSQGPPTSMRSWC